MLSGTFHRTEERFMRTSLKPRLVVLLLVAMLLSACGQVAAKPRATATVPSPTPFPTLTPAPTVAVTTIQSTGDPVWGKTASWSHANLPAGFGMQFHVLDVQVAASDGKTAYACAVIGNQTQPGHPQVIVTHDGGMSWTHVSGIPVSWYGCATLAVDMLDPSIVVAAGDVGGGPQEVTVDGGATWRPLSLPPDQAVLQLATAGGKTYAFIEVPQNGGQSAVVLLSESSDHMRTWREIDGPLRNANLRQFWVDPANGALMLRAYDSGLWTSTDDGATWVQIEVPSVVPVDYIVEQPAAHQPWRLCGTYFASQNDSTLSLICTMDGGHSWYCAPILKFWEAAGIANDGAILVYDRSYMVYRLPQSATRWQKLGVAELAGSSIRFVPSGAGGMLWKFPAESDGGPISDKPNDLSSAVYPY
jgi:photosystem II stability/assembly factor-like uncharacterized protein